MVPLKVKNWGPILVTVPSMERKSPSLAVLATDDGDACHPGAFFTVALPISLWFPADPVEGESRVGREVVRSAFGW